MARSTFSFLRWKQIRSKFLTDLSDDGAHSRGKTTHLHLPIYRFSRKVFKNPPTDGRRRIPFLLFVLKMKGKHLHTNGCRIMLWLLIRSTARRKGQDRASVCGNWKGKTNIPVCPSIPSLVKEGIVLRILVGNPLLRINVLNESIP